MIVATCYQYTSSDVASAQGGADAGGNYDLDNCKSANLTLRGRNTSTTDNYGLRIVLAANTTIYCAELVNSTITGSERCSFEVYSNTPPVTQVYYTGSAGSNRIRAPIASYSSLTLLEEVPSRENTIIGIDFASTGASLTGALASVSAREVYAKFYSAAAGRTYWELAYLALGTNGATITSPSSISPRRIALRHGWGWRCEVRWEKLAMAQAARLDSLKAATHDGSLPCFIFPYPGTRNSSGVMVDPNTERSDETFVTPGHRGGLSRLIDFDYTAPADVGALNYATGATLTFESWQEVPASEGRS